MTEALLSEGFVKVREGGRNIPQLKHLVEIEEVARSQGKGIWGSDLQVIYISAHKLKRYVKNNECADYL